MTRLLLLLATAGSLAAQETPRVGAGLQFSAPFFGTFVDVGGREFAGDASGHLSLGPALRFRLASRADLVLSGLYRRIGRDAGGGYFGFSDRERGYSWEFPVLGRYRLSGRRLRPFVTAGPNFLWTRTHTDSLIPDFIPIDSSFTVRYRSVQSTSTDAFAGIAAGCGLELQRGKARVAVETRYTRWLGTGPCYSTDLRCVSPNQAGLYFGVGF